MYNLWNIGLVAASSSLYMYVVTGHCLFLRVVILLCPLVQCPLFFSNFHVCFYDSFQNQIPERVSSFVCKLLQKKKRNMKIAHFNHQNAKTIALQCTLGYMQVLCFHHVVKVWLIVWSVS